MTEAAQKTSRCFQLHLTDVDPLAADLSSDVRSSLSSWIGVISYSFLKVLLAFKDSANGIIYLVPKG